MRIILALFVAACFLAASTALAQQAHEAGGRPSRADLEKGPPALFPPSEGYWPGSLPLLNLPGKVEPELLKQVLLGEPGSQFRFVVELVPQADLASAEGTAERPDTRYLVVARLQETATESQADLLAFLEARRAAGRVQQVHAFWIFNGLAVTADADTLLAVAARPEVKVVRPDRWAYRLDPTFVPEPGAVAGAAGVGWNIARIRADLARDALGLDGSGVTVAIMDTGVDWQHPALRAQYRGYKVGGLVQHDGHWACTTDEDYRYPVDGHGHGTHVAGIAVGGQDPAGDGPAIGVAPGARWVAVKTLNNEGFGYDSWIHAAFQWLLAPAGDPALAPDIVNGSWGYPYGERETFRADVQALRAAGIVPVFAAGNYGPEPSSLGSPASYPEAIAVGATDDLDSVVRESSRGPSPWGEVKPEVVAPGVQVRSSLPGGTYGLANGTSVATPHVAGLVALLLQADPARTVDGIEMILTSTAHPLGDQPPDNRSGWGRIDAYQAAAVTLQAGFVVGQVRASPGGEPLPGAQVTARKGEQGATVEAGSGGGYRLALPPGRYDVEAGAFGYKAQTEYGIRVQAAVTTSLDLVLRARPTGTLQGQVRQTSTGEPVGAEISLAGTPASTASDPQTGAYSLDLPAGRYTLEAARNGYRRHTSAGVEIEAGAVTQLDITLLPAPTLLLVDSGRWYYESQSETFVRALADRDFVHDTWEIRDLLTDVPALEDLRPYDIVLWSSPSDAPGLIGAGDVISDYLSAGGNLFLTGQDVGFWDDGLSGRTWHEYYGQFLKAKAVADDAGRADVVGLPGEILADLVLAVNGPDSAANQYTPDLVGLRDGRQAALVARYREEQGGEGAGQVLPGAGTRAGGCPPYAGKRMYRAVYLAAGLEGLGDGAERAEVLERSLGWLDSPHPDVGAALDPDRQEAVWLGGSSITYTVELRNTGRLPDQFDLSLSPSAWPAAVWDGDFSRPLAQSLALGACQTQTLGIEVTVPPGVEWNATDAVTLTARSTADPGRSVQAAFHSKTPAPILLVDDHRWYDTLDAYRGALAANGLPYDVWRIEPDLKPEAGSPTLDRLRRYPVVLWFTAYDWSATLTPHDEAVLAAYLAGPPGDGGGRLLLSSQDYLYASDSREFARAYLGVASYTDNMTTTQVSGATGSPVGRGAGAMSLDYPFRDWSDGLRPTAVAAVAFWGQHGQPVALTRAEPGSGVRAAWKSAFFGFPLEALADADRATVIGQTVDWLSPLGDSTLHADRAVIEAGAQLAYSLAVRNTGPEPLGRVSLSNPVPAHTEFVAGSLTGPALYDPDGERLTWQGELSPGQAITIGYRLQVDGRAPDGTVVRNVARLLEESGLAVERSSVSRVRAPDLSGSVKAASAVVARAGQVLTYTLVLRNDGLRPARASLVDPVPPLSTYRPGSARASSGELVDSADAVSWAGPVAAGQRVTLTFPVAVGSGAAGMYVYNRARLDDGWGEVRALEAATWVEARAYLPVVARQR